MVQDDKVLSIRAAADYLSLNRLTVWKLLRDGKLPGAKVGGVWRIRKNDLDRFLSGHHPATA